MASRIRGRRSRRVSSARLYIWGSQYGSVALGSWGKYVSGVGQLLLCFRQVCIVPVRSLGLLRVAVIFPLVVFEVQLFSLA